MGPAESGGDGPRPGRSFYIVLLVFVVLAAGLGYGVLDSRRIRIEHVAIPCPKLPAALSGFSIIQFSDLHSTPDFALNREAAGLLEGLQGDIMVITGDFRNSAGTSRIAAEGARLVIRPVLQRMPVYAVRGNNDRADTMRLVGQEGIRVLENRAVRIREGLWLAGWDPYEKGHTSLEKVMAEVPAEEAVILASHSPDVILEKGYTRACLIVAGHTHGVQIGIPGLPSPIALTRAGWRYTRGLYKLGGTCLYINRGIGTTMVPLRVYSAPEITVLTLSAASAPPR